MKNGVDHIKAVMWRLLNMQSKIRSWNKSYRAAIVLIVLFIFAYVINFLWESFHAFILYEDHNLLSTEYVPMMSYVATVDAFLISAIYLIIAGMFRNLFWIKEIRKGSLITFAILGIIIAAFIEYRAVFLIDRWSYSDLMPTLFGIGISPLFQLAITGLVAIYIVHTILFREPVF